jgi:hypothetical protein
VDQIQPIAENLNTDSAGGVIRTKKKKKKRTARMTMGSKTPPRVKARRELAKQAPSLGLDCSDNAISHLVSHSPVSGVVEEMINTPQITLHGVERSQRRSVSPEAGPANQDSRAEKTLDRAEWTNTSSGLSRIATFPEEGMQEDSSSRAKLPSSTWITSQYVI